MLTRENLVGLPETERMALVREENQSGMPPGCHDSLVKFDRLLGRGIGIGVILPLMLYL